MLQPSDAVDLPTPADFDRHPGLLPVRIPAQSADPEVGDPLVRIRAHDNGQVVVIDVAGRLGDVVEDLDRAIQLALADGPRGVVCDLSGVPEGAGAGDVDRLAAAGRHVRDWPGIPVALACPDPRVRETLAAHPVGGQLIVTGSVLTAVSWVLARPTPVVEWLRLASHPADLHAARDFVTSTLLDWGLGSLVHSVGLVVSELVTNAATHAGAASELSVAWNLGGLRVTVRDSSPDMPRQRYSQFDLRGRGVSAVVGLCRTFGVLPTADGGKVVWAVLNAARPRPSTS